MKVAVCVHNGVKSDARVLKEATTLANSGHEVTVFGLHDDAPTEWTTDAGVKIKVSQRDKAAAAARVRKIENPTDADKIRASYEAQGRTVATALLNSVVPDVIHIHDHVILTAAPFLKSVCDVPIVWDAHEIYEDLAGVADARAEVNPSVIAECSTVVDHFVTINESIARFYAEKYPTLADAVILPNSRVFEELPAYDGRLHASARIPLGQKVLLFQGGFSLHRGIRILLDASAAMPDGWTVVFMGWGTLKTEIENHTNATDSRGVPKVACIDGAPNSELLLWTSGASVGIIPYEDRGLNHEFCTPNKLWEYPLAGVPILATRFPEMTKTIEPNGIGWTLPRDFSAQDIASRIASLDDHAIEAAREACRRFVMEDNWSVHEQRLVALYEDISEDTKLSWQTHEQFVSGLQL